MKKIINIALLTLLIYNVSFAQNNQGTIDDFGRICLKPVLAEDMGDMPTGAKKMLLSRLKQAATKNGLGSNSAIPQFIITGTIDVIDKEITETAPPMIAYNLEANLYICDYVNKTVLSNVTLELKGVGKTETKAYISAIKRINPKSSKVRSFIKKGKNKIIEYYNTQCEMIMKKANTLAKVNDYEGAIYTLMSIPTVCKECHYKALNAIEPIYKKMIGETCEEDLEAAKSAYKEGDMIKAKSFLENIQPGTDCYDKAVDLARKINKKNEDSKVNMKTEEPKTNEEKAKVYKEVAAKSSADNDKTNSDKEYDLDFIENK